MYLRAIEIQGFKSFPDPTRLTFENEITAIVGPNGCGKSNISDAVLWVMGEQSSKTLRGGRMQDVIFGGTLKRGALGFAQVTLILDNSAGILDNSAEEVSISRKYYRSGESEYCINREQVRLRDVCELLMDTGLGRDGYSIIGQGRIAEIISGRSEERREVLEEAAGIARFRHRKDDAERKLARTDENLLRIKDKTDELELQINPLREQAETARKYLNLRDELRVGEVSLWMQNLDDLHEQSADVEAGYEQARKNLEAARAEVEQLYAKSEKLAERMREKDMEAERMRARLSQTEAEASGCEAEAAVLRANMKNNAEQIRRMRSEIAAQDERVKSIAAQAGEKTALAAELGRRAEELGKKAAAAKNVADGRRMRIANREAEASAVSEELTKQIVELRSLDSRAAMLEEMKKEYEGFGKAVKAVMSEAKHGTLRGIHGTVAELIRTDDRYTLAIETALGAAIQDIVVDRQADGRACIEMLKRRSIGRATFLPLDVMRGGVLGGVPSAEEGCIGLACDLVSFNEKYRAVMENLLGRTLVAEDLRDASAMSKKSGAKLRIVTLDGQLINAGGSMTGGSAVRSAGILSRTNELEKLGAARSAAAKRRDELVGESDRIKRELQTARYELDMAVSDSVEAEKELSSVTAERRATEAAGAQLELLRLSISGDCEERARAAAEIEAGTESFEKELAAREKRLEELNALAEEIKSGISAANSDRLEVEGERSGTDRLVQEKNSRLLDLERSCSRLEQKKLSADMEEKQIIDRLWDNYGLSHSAAGELRRPVENRFEAGRHISELKKKMNALGSPNLGAIDEYARVSERYDFLTAQRDDIEKARGELLDIINDVTEHMRAIFSEQFALINEKFGEVFTELFGGGRAELRLEDENDILGSDIDIRVQPPGKALSAISLLSGGEMAFAAIALYFAIIRVRPTPFCIMDEIEAALDEANVTRFASYMRRISSGTQFIVITHRRGTMEEADNLYGVTMQEKGVSKVIELDLAEAEKHIEEMDREWDSSIK